MLSLCIGFLCFISFNLWRNVLFMSSLFYLISCVFFRMVHRLYSSYFTTLIFLFSVEIVNFRTRNTRFLWHLIRFPLCCIVFTLNDVNNFDFNFYFSLCRFSYYFRAYRFSDTFNDVQKMFCADMKSRLVKAAKEEVWKEEQSENESLFKKSKRISIMKRWASGSSRSIARNKLETCWYPLMSYHSHPSQVWNSNFEYRSSVNIYDKLCALKVILLGRMKANILFVDHLSKWISKWTIEFRTPVLWKDMIFSYKTLKTCSNLFLPVIISLGTFSDIPT